MCLFLFGGSVRRSVGEWAAYVDVSATMLELAISVGVSLRSFLMVRVNCILLVYLLARVVIEGLGFLCRTRGPEAETHTYTATVSNPSRTSPSCQVCEGKYHQTDLPIQKRNHETEPGKEKDAAMSVEWVEDGNRASLAVGGVELGSLPEDS